MLELPKLKKGGLGVISQSGSLIGALLAHGSSRGIGFSKLISVGNETDLAVGAIGKILVDDVNTDTIILFLETLRNSNEIAEMARLAYSSGKAVITYKLGKSDLGKELAKSHTGAIAGSDEAFNAFIKFNGITRVHMFETLIEVPNLFKNKVIAKGKRVGIATTTGGGGAMVVESLSDANIEVIDPGPSISKVMKKHNIPYDNNKLVDLTIAGAKPEIVNDVIQEFMNNDNCDLVIMVVGSSAKFRSDQAIDPLLKWANNSKPLAVYVAPDAPEALELLNKNGNDDGIIGANQALQSYHCKHQISCQLGLSFAFTSEKSQEDDSEQSSSIIGQTKRTISIVHDASDPLEKVVEELMPEPGVVVKRSTGQLEPLLLTPTASLFSCIPGFP